MLGFSQVVAEANWNTANAESIRKAARDAGIELRLTDAHRSQENQVAQLRSFISQRVDVIAFSPVIENGWEVVLREIRSAGIPVILMDRTIEVSDDSLYVALIGSDFVEEGRRAGRWLLDRARAREVTAGFLQAEGHRIRVLFAHSDSMALGAIEAIDAAGFKPGSDILVISIEGSRKALEAIVAGKLNVTVECSPLLGPQLIAVVKELAAGKSVPRRVITRESVFTRENAALELPNRAY